MNKKPTKGEQTRNRLLDLAEKSVLEKGFAATSIDELIAAAGITKSGFFYHFKDKSELAKHMYLRYLERDNQLFKDLFTRADDLSNDPLHSLLIFVKLFAEVLEDLPETHPGCLVASYCYQHQLFNEEIRDLNCQGVLSWRELFRDRLEPVAQKYPAPGADLTAIADLFTTLVEGGIILSRSLDDRHVLPKQVLLYRDYLQRIFIPSAA